MTWPSKSSQNFKHGVLQSGSLGSLTKMKNRELVSLKNFLVNYLAKLQQNEYLLIRKREKIILFVPTLFFSLLPKHHKSEKRQDYHFLAWFHESQVQLVPYVGTWKTEISSRMEISNMSSRWYKKYRPQRVQNLIRRLSTKWKFSTDTKLIL